MIWNSQLDCFDGLEQEKRNSSVLAMELRLSCINPLVLHCSLMFTIKNIYFFVETWSYCLHTDSFSNVNKNIH